MGRLFNLDSPLMVFLSKVADLMILNIITLFLCIPIITAGDAMTALYYMTIKMVRGEDCYIVRGYFKSFKENFKQATIIWVLAVLVFLILIGDFSIIRSGLLSFGRVMTVLLIIITVIYVFTMLYVFPVLSRFENTVKNTIRNAFLMSILNLPRTILLVIINLIPFALLLLFVQSVPFVILFGFSVPAYLCSTQFVKIFNALSRKRRMWRTAKSWRRCPSYGKRRKRKRSRESWKRSRSAKGFRRSVPRWKKTARKLRKILSAKRSRMLQKRRNSMAYGKCV